MDSREAFERVKAGERVRLPSWPPGQYLKLRRFGPQPGDWDVALYRDYSLSGLSHSPSSGELSSNDWETCALPAGQGECDHIA